MHSIDIIWSLLDWIVFRSIGDFKIWFWSLFSEFFDRNNSVKSDNCIADNLGSNVRHCNSLTRMYRCLINLHINSFNEAFENVYFKCYLTSLLCCHHHQMFYNFFVFLAEINFSFSYQFLVFGPISQSLSEWTKTFTSYKFHSIYAALLEISKFA